MSVFRYGIGAACAALLATGSAMAADPITIATTSPVTMPVAQPTDFDWTGFYAGVYGAGQFGDDSGDQFGLGISAGFNAQFDFYLLGAEVAVHGITGDVGDNGYGQILGRAGLVVTDDAVIYAAGGYGIDLGPSTQSDALIGGGVEMAITDSLSVEAQYLHGFPLEGDNDTNQFTVGANFHF